MRKVTSGLVVAAVWLVSGAASAAGKIVINEFLVNPAGDDGGKEWIELYNAGDEAVAIGGHKLQAVNAGGPVLIATITAGTMLAPNAYYVVGGNAVQAAQQTDLLSPTAGSIYNAGNNGAGVRLVTSNDVTVDTVVYGSNNGGVVDDTGVAAVSLAPKPGNDDVISRVPNGSDTDASGVDFVITDGTLGASNGGEVVPDAGVDDGGSNDAGSEDAGSDAGDEEDSGTTSSGSSGATSSGSSGTSSSGNASSSSSGAGSSSGSSSGRSSSSGGRSSSSGGKSDAGKTGSSSGDEDGDDDATATTDDGGCNTGPGGSLPLAGVLGTGLLALLLRRRRTA